MSAALRRSVSSLEIPNYRRYFAGQIVSLSGNWMQMVAEMWLILELTGSGVAVGVTSALQFLPILLFGAWGGALADRLPKRRLLIYTQAAMAVPALLLWGVTASGSVEPWMVFALVFVRGSINSIDNPTRQSFVIEIVGGDRVVNAVGLNSVLIHAARIVGPAGAGILIATVGVAPCFLLNATTFAAMIVALHSINPERLDPAPRPGKDGGVRAALRYVRSEPSLWIPLAMMAVAGTLAFNFHVLLPLLARFSFGGGAGAYSALAIAMAVGSIAGALFTGARGRVGDRLIVVAGAGFGVSALLVAAAPTLPLALIAFVPLGAASVTFAAGINSTLQLGAEPAMRGRVMALYTVVFLGSTPIGGPLVGWLAEVAGPRAGLVLGGIAALATALGGWIAFSRARGEPAFPRLTPNPFAPGGKAEEANGTFGIPGRRRWRRLRAWRPVAVQPWGPNQLQGLEGGARLDVEADAVAVLDRGDSGLVAAPQQRDPDREAGSDRGDLGPDPTRDPAADREDGDRPQPQDRDPARALGRQAGGGPRRREHRPDRLRRARRAPQKQAGECGEEPPRARDDQRRRIPVAVGDDDADGAEDRGDAGDEQHRHAKQVAVEH